MNTFGQQVREHMRTENMKKKRMTKVTQQSLLPQQNVRLENCIARADNKFGEHTRPPYLPKRKCCYFLFSEKNCLIFVACARR